MILIVSIPHSGTRYVQDALTKAGYNLPRNTNRIGERGLILHWHSLEEQLPEKQWDLQKVGLLRDPLATIISHWRSKDKSSVPSQRLWPQRLREMWKGWQRMDKYYDKTFFLPVEPLGHRGDCELLFEKLMAFHTGLEAPINFIGVDKYSNSYPLKEAYLSHDFDEIEKTIPDGVSLARKVIARMGHIYEDAGYDFWWAK